MLKIVCDKCGKAVFTTSVESTSMKNRITILDRQYDLCRECKLEVMMFINGKMPYEDCEDCETHLKAQSKTENSSEIPNNCEPKTGKMMTEEEFDSMLARVLIGKDEPQPNADQHVQRIEYVGNDEKSRCWTCKHFERMHETPISSDGSYYTYVVCTAKECKYEPKDETQTEEPPMDEYYKDHDEFYDCDRYVITNDEGERAYNCIGCHTDCSWK